MKQSDKESLIMNIILLIATMIGLVLVSMNIVVLGQLVAAILIFTCVAMSALANIRHIAHGSTTTTNDSVSPYDPTDSSNRLSKETRDEIASRHLPFDA